tara:strand:- start:941 stop:1339 length:399 start_codon:yes stop_codon:yes gene_type:complete
VKLKHRETVKTLFVWFLYHLENTRVFISTIITKNRKKSKMTNNVIKVKKTRLTKWDAGAGMAIGMFYNWFIHNLKKNGMNTDEIYSVLKETRKEYCDWFNNGKADELLNDMEIFREDVFSNKDTFREYLEMK